MDCPTREGVQVKPGEKVNLQVQNPAFRCGLGRKGGPSRVGNCSSKPMPLHFKLYIQNYCEKLTSLNFSVKDGQLRMKNRQRNLAKWPLTSCSGLPISVCCASPLS
jgi:hypothetical protein